MDTDVRRIAIHPFPRPTRERLGRLAAWYAVEYEPLLRFAYFLAGDPATAEDLVQETFVRLHRAGDRVHDDGFPAYARATLLNLNRSGLRRVARERRAFGRIGIGRAGGDPADRAHGLDVRRALFALSTRQRACLALRFYEDMEDKRIAETLGMSLSAVKKNVQRGLQRMRTALEEVEGS